MWGVKPPPKKGAGGKAPSLSRFCAYIATNERVRLGKGVVCQGNEGYIQSKHIINCRKTYIL